MEILQNVQVSRLTSGVSRSPYHYSIPQYRYICGICRNRGHYDHQCHTLQHLAHAMQSQQTQGYNPTNNPPEYDNNNDQPAF